MNSTKTLRKTGILYTVITVFTNAVINITLSITPSPVIDQDTVSKWLKFVNDSKLACFLATFIPFTMPVIVCLWYFLRNGTEEKLKQRAVQLPLVMATASLSGWLSNLLIMIAYSFIAKYKLGIAIRLLVTTSAISSLMVGISSFTMVYLILEALNQRILLPLLFPEGKISTVHTSFRPTFGVLLAMTFIISSLWPMAYLINGMSAILINNGIKIHKGLLFISSVLLVTAFLITLMLSRKIVSPLKELTHAAERIKAGDYKTKLHIITNDEMGSLADTFNDMTCALAEKEFMRDTFGKVVDPNVRDYLMKSGVALKGESLEVTVLFCDIRSFTAMSEKMQAEEVVSLLNRYFTVLGKCIAKHNGIINKYIGDAIMAMFGAPIKSETHAQDAYLAALDMRHSLAALNEELCAEGKSPLRFGIGIHTGKVFAGTIGASDRMEYTIIGDTVNTASRMESLCKTYKTDILLSEATVLQLGKNLQESKVNFFDEASIRGKEDKIRVYTINSD